MQNNIEDVVKKSTQMWKVSYGLTIVKEGEQEPIEVKNDEEDDQENTIEGGAEMNIDDKEIAEPEQQEEQNVQDTQLPSVSPQHVTNENTKIVTIKDVFDVIAQNINPLIEEDLKKMLD